MEINQTELKRLRQYAGLTIRDLAKQAGISHAHLAYIEKGERKPREGVTKKLADALNVSMEDIVVNHG